MSIWIADNNQLKNLCDQLAHCDLIAIDTEFIRTNTFYPKLALIQLSDGKNIWLIDVLAIEDFLPLKKSRRMSALSDMWIVGQWSGRTH